MTAVLFVAAAGLGAAARLRINQYGWTWLSTLAANVVGSFGLGWLLTTAPSESTVTVVGTGFFGTLTTFSMFALEATEGAPRRRIAVIASTLVLGLIAATVGHALS
jgi:CrcB protein